MEVSFQQKRKLTLSAPYEPAKRLPGHHHQQSWEGEYFADTETIVGLERRWSSNIERTSVRFPITGLRFIQSLYQTPPEVTAQVWLAEGPQGLYAVKLFRPYTDDEARNQWSRLRYPKPSLQKVRDDYSPFLQEVKAYEQIRQFCPDSQRHLFPNYHGIIDIPWGSGLDRRQGVVLDLLQPGIENRRLQSASVPEDFRPHLDALQLALTDMALSDVEASWYLSVLKGRLKMVTALHALGISHGDIKDDCFGLPDQTLHDIALHDFSWSYTFTPERPCRLLLRTLREAVAVERYLVQGTVLNLAQSARLLNYFATLLNTTAEMARDMLHARVPRHLLTAELSLVRLSVALDENDAPFFPSLSSVLPFLEPAASGRTAEWTVTIAKHLDDFVCVSYSEANNFAVPSQSVIAASLVSSSGVVIEQLGLLCPNASPPSKNTVALVPSSWLGTLDTRWLCWILLYSPSFCGTGTVTVLDRQQLDAVMNQVH